MANTQDYFEVQKGLSIDGVIWTTGSGSPEGVVTASMGSKYTDTVTGFEYIKASGTGNVGWTKISEQTSISDEDYLQNDFMGKTGTGETMPIYTSTTQVIQNSALDDAISQLDAEIGADPTPVTTRTNNPIIGANSVNANIDALDAAIGVDVTAVSRTIGPITTSNSVNENIDALDTAIGADVTPTIRTVGAIVAANSVNDNIEQLDTAIGTDAQLSGGTYVSTANSVNQNLKSLDAQVVVNTSNIAALSGGVTNWKEFCKVLTGDASAYGAANGTSLASLLPFSDDEGGTGNTIVITDFAAGDYILTKSGANAKIFWVYDDGGTLKITSITTGMSQPTEGDVYGIKWTLPNSPGELENGSIQLMTSTGLNKVADYNWQLATGINVSGTYTAISGNPAPNDSVEKVLQNIDGNVDAVNTLTGIAQGGTTLGTFPGGTIVSDNTTVKNAIAELDAEATDVRTLIGDTGTGNNDNLGSFTGSTITDNTTIKTALQELETATEANGVRVVKNGVTTIDTVDQELVDSTNVVIWDIFIYQASTSKFQHSEVHALNNGTISGDATSSDWNEISILRIGTKISGLALTVDLTGSGTSQYMRLRASATASIDLKVVRRII